MHRKYDALIAESIANGFYARPCGLMFVGRIAYSVAPRNTLAPFLD